MAYLCDRCAPEDETSFHIGELIIGICESEFCENIDYPIEKTPIRDYRLRESCGGDE